MGGGEGLGRGGGRILRPFFTEDPQQRPLLIKRNFRPSTCLFISPKNPVREICLSLKTGGPGARVLLLVI